MSLTDHPSMDHKVNHQSSGSDQPLAEMLNISKAYPGCIANDAVSLSLYRGKVHALLGENGAGKSTLVKVLYGLLQSDSGTIHWQGEAVEISSPRVARELGIAMVFQHFSLFDSLTVLENVALGMDQDADDSLKQQIVQVSKKYGLPLDPDRSVYTLSVGERQRIEIVRCLLQEPQLLIMDEPTSVLTPLEVSELFTTLTRLASEGMAILYISHKLEEIRTLCDEATILRQGKKVAYADPKNESAKSLAALMMGSAPPVDNSVTRSTAGENLLHINNLQLKSNEQHVIELKSIQLSVSAGEIVGIAGVAGNGQDELLSVLSGEQAVSPAESIKLKNQPIGRSSPGERRQLGLCCVPEQRLGHAAVPSLSLAENTFLTAHYRKPLKMLGMISARKSTAFAKEIIERFNVQCNGPEALAGSLSGGNLQKFIVGREILQNPGVLIISQPTWGVDAGAAYAIHEAIKELAASGAAILLISQDLDELFAISHRIGALCAGYLSPFYSTSSVTMQQVGILMGGGQLELSHESSNPEASQ